MKVNLTRSIAAASLLALLQAPACTIENPADDGDGDLGGASGDGDGDKKKEKKPSGDDSKSKSSGDGDGDMGGASGDGDGDMGGAPGEDAEDDNSPTDDDDKKSETNKVVSVDVAFAHECKAFTDGHVECRGDGRVGQLGADAYKSSSKDWVNVKGLAGRAIEVAVGHAHSCALLQNGAVQCWGYNGYGELGDGSTDESELPVTVAELPKASMISAGGYKTCAILESSGEVKCWGNNHSGQLGNGSKTNPSTSSIPLSVLGLDDIKSIDVGTVSTCAVKKNGNAYCWGDNGNRTLGNGESADSAVPTLVANIENAVDISVGELHACAVVSDGRTWCWGRHSASAWYGLLGTGTSNVSYREEPVLLEDAPDATRVSVGDEFACLIAASDGSVWCWGNNQGGRLGNGKTSNSATPVAAISTPNDVTSIAAGRSSTCAVRRGEAVCWGN